MNLPELPRVLKKKEADFGLYFRKWLEKNPMPSALFELKQTGSKDYLSFEAVKPHQIKGLLDAKGRQGLLYKAPDDSRTEKPGDYFYLNNALGYIVIKYPKGFEGISIENFLREKDKNERKSLTYERAMAISAFSLVF